MKSHDQTRLDSMQNGWDAFVKLFSESASCWQRNFVPSTANATFPLPPSNICSCNSRVESAKRNRAGKVTYQKYAPSERAEIGKYTAIHGASAACKHFKPLLAGTWSSWAYSPQVQERTHEQTPEKERKTDEQITIDLRMSTVKPLSCGWFLAAVDHLRSNPDIVTNGFPKAGIHLCSWIWFQRTDCVGKIDCCWLY